jgi:Na+/melibiose symporter-like transporter
VGLPLYVNLPKYYADTLPLSLALLGTLLFITRLLDCFLDPLIGRLSDAYPHRRKQLMLLSVPILAVGVVFLFYLPSVATASNVAVLLGVGMSCTYIAYSVLSINYYAAGLPLAADATQTTRVSAWRETAIIIGVLVASILPQVLLTKMPQQQAYHLFSLVFVGVLAGGILVFLPLLKKITGASGTEVDASQGAWKKLWANRPLRWVFGVFLLNAIPPSITATLFLFFAASVLQAEAMSGPFLLVYFLGAMCAMPLWAKLSRKVGKKRALMGAMSLAIASFIWAYFLKAGDALPFFLICVASGAALGGDLALLPSLLADTLEDDKEQGGLAFGVWNFISKFTLALAAGIALPALGMLGYTGTHSTDGGSIHALQLSYAVLPCTFKIGALVVLLISPLGNTRQRNTA